MTLRQSDFLEEVGRLLGQALLLLAPDGAVLASNQQAKELLPEAILKPSPAGQGNTLFSDVLEQLSEAPSAAVESCLKVPGEPPLRCRAIRIGPPATALIALGTGAMLEPTFFGSEVLSILNHEFRTPLATLCGFAELMLNREFDEATRRSFLETIRGESFRLARLFKNLIDLQRMRSQDFALHLETVEFGSLVERACAQQLRANPERRIELHLPTHAVNTRVDPVKLSRVLDILLENAFRMCDEASALQVTVRVSKRHLFFAVATSGAGIPIEAAKEIFVANYRPRQTDWPRLDGFSLPLAKSIIDAHTGRIWVETEPTKQSALNLSLPLDNPPATF